MLLTLLLNLGPVVTPVTPVTIKRGGDDVPREEYWETHKPETSRDATLDKVIRDAYAKIAHPELEIKPVAERDDDEDVLLLLLL